MTHSGRAMDIKHAMGGDSPGNPGPIPFSMSSPDQVLKGTIAISPYLGNPDVVALEVHLAGKRLGSAALTEEGALDLALRLVGTIMNRRMDRTSENGAAIEYLP
jgi:hypothetical protein